eukprot:203994-Pelagomonas_calceolata.AAC.1
MPKHTSKYPKALQLAASSGGDWIISQGVWREAVSLFSEESTVSREGNILLWAGKGHDQVRSAWLQIQANAVGLGQVSYH